MSKNKQHNDTAYLNLKISENEIFATTCYKALQKIKSIIEDDCFDTKEQIIRIEKIIGLFDILGTNKN